THVMGVIPEAVQFVDGLCMSMSGLHPHNPDRSGRGPHLAIKVWLRKKRRRPPRHSRRVIAGLILAAGESRRMGSPKALLPYRGESFLDTLTGLFRAFCDPVIVVLGAGAEDIRAAVHRPATFVVNPQFRLGMTTSMQRGLEAV